MFQDILRTDIVDEHVFQMLLFYSRKEAICLCILCAFTYLYKICDRAGIKHFSIHKLRHTFATRALEAGCSYKWLADMLGHRNINTTMMTYCHVSSVANKAEATRLAEYHSKQVSNLCETA